MSFSVDVFFFKPRIRRISTFQAPTVSWLTSPKDFRNMNKLRQKTLSRIDEVQRALLALLFVRSQRLATTEDSWVHCFFCLSCCITSHQSYL